MTSDPAPSASGAHKMALTPAAGCILSVLFGGAVMLVFIAAMLLALRGELAFERGTPQEIRIWLISEPGGQGLGFSSARRISVTEDGSQECDLRQARFFLWRSDAPSPAVTYCECYTRAAQGWVSLGACPPN